MPNKPIKTLKALKNKLKKTLPDKISQVIQSYEEFSEQPVPEDAKGFSAHHSACKSAVIHAETLLKLARWTSEDENRIEPSSLALDNDILSILDEAQQEEDKDE